MPTRRLGNRSGRWAGVGVRLAALIFSGLWIPLAHAQHTSTECPPQTATVASGGTVTLNITDCASNIAFAGIGLVDGGSSLPQAFDFPDHGTAIQRITAGQWFLDYSHNGSSGIGSTDVFEFTEATATGNGDVRVTITITPASSPITVLPGVLPTLTAGTAFNQTLTASGGQAPYTYALQSGALPIGLNLSSAGVLSGTPTQRGAYSFSVRATDATTPTAQFVDKGYTASVNNPAMTLTTATGTALQTLPFTQTLVIAGGVPPYACLLETGAFPSGISISPGCVVSGTTNAAAASYPVVIRVTDSSTGPGSWFEAENYTLTVSPPRPRLTLQAVSAGGVGGFGFTGSNGWSAQTLTTTVPGTAVTGATQILAASSTATTITTTPPAGFLLTGATCTGLGAGGSATVSGTALTLDAAATAATANIQCTFSFARRPTLTLTALSTGGIGAFGFSGTNGWSAQTLTTVTPGVAVTGATQTLAAPGTSTTLNITLPAAFLLTGASCTGLGAGGTATLAGTSLTLNAAATAAGANIQCSVSFLALPTLSINDVSLNEGNAGTTAFNFTVSLSAPAPAGGVGFSIITADGTATAGVDYLARSLSGQTIPAGGSSYTFAVQVNGDVDFEPNEGFFVQLADVLNATAGDVQGVGTIVNDDPNPCAAYVFPYTLGGNTPAELIQAIQCANGNGAAEDVIDLAGRTITLTASHANVLGANIGLPQITTAVTLRNGTIQRSSTEPFRFFLNTGTLQLRNLTLSGADAQADGGAIFNFGAGAVLNVTNSRLLGNYASYGGAMFVGTGSSATLVNTLVAGNRAYAPGGGIRNRGTLTLINSTIAANFTTAGTEGGGGIANNAGVVILDNTLVFGNESSSFPAAREISGAYLSNSSLVGVDPSFVNLLDAGDTAPSTGGDYRLAHFSAAIDAGDNGLLPGGTTTDLAGNPRRYNDTGVVDTGVGTAPLVDIGAYEKQTPSVLPQADVSISKTDGQISVNAGSTAVYTLTATNAGPDPAPAAMVADTFPAACVSPGWTCVGTGGGSCAASGSGHIHEAVNLPVGGGVTFTAICPVSLAATGTLSNTATVSAGLTDPNPANNSATDTTTVIAAPVLSINSVGWVEGDAGSSLLAFTVARTTTGTAFTVDYASADGTASAGSDYTATHGTVNFTAGGAATQVIQVPVTGDLRVEGSESFTLSLSNATGTAQIGTATGTATITDNDGATVQFAPVSLSQSEASSPMVYTVTLSHPVQSGVTLRVDSAPGTATAADFTAITAATLSFPPDSAAAQTVQVVIANDALDEDDEQYTLALSGLTAVGDVSLPTGTATATGIIEDEDALPVLSVANVSQPEGNAGPASMSFTVHLTPVSGRAVSFSRATLDGTATAPSDYQALAATTLTIPPGQTSLSIPVSINGDTTYEGDETFTLALTGISHALPGTLTVLGTLEDDDVQPTSTSITADLPDPSVVGQGYPVQVTVSAPRAAPLGEVMVTDGSGASCSAALLPGVPPASSMSCTLTSTTAGSKTLSAHFVPASAAFGASSDVEAHLVTAAATTLQLSGPPTVRFNTPASYTATLAVNVPGSGTPAGTVTVSSGAHSCVISVPTAIPSCALSFPTLGPRTVSAVFTPADAHFLGAGADPVTTLAYASTDLAVTKSDGLGSYQPNDLLVYTVEVENRGPDVAPGLRLLDPVPAGLTHVAWTCVGQGGAFCPSAGGVNDLDMTVQILPSGGRLVISYYGNVQGSVAEIINVARVELPASGTLNDPEPGNNSATDIDRLDGVLADGFESPLVRGAAGALALDPGALRSTLGRTAWSLLTLDDHLGVAARVYVRMLEGQIEYALAARDEEGRLRLEAWRSHAGTPTLRWTAVPRGSGWRVTRMWID